MITFRRVIYFFRKLFITYSLIIKLLQLMQKEVVAHYRSGFDKLPKRRFEINRIINNVSIYNIMHIKNGIIVNK